MIYDGVGINPFNNNVAYAIQGSRHGNIAGSSTDVTGVKGSTNVLFIDGHAQSVGRALMPSVANHAYLVDGNPAALSSLYHWPLWRMDQ